MALGIGQQQRTRSGQRTASCPYCGNTIAVAREAVSVPCGKCNRRVELEDLEVFENISRALMTGASVFVRGEATVTGDIHAGEIVVSGVVRGNLKAFVRVKLESTAKVFGMIEAPSIDLENGATVQGDLKIRPKQMESA
jgi:predicted acyltransferase (DUF342 family)/ribosomal protein S27AE